MLIMGSVNPNKPSAPININNPRRPSQASASSSGSSRRPQQQSRFELGPPSLQDRSGFEAIAEFSGQADTSCHACQRLGFHCTTGDDSDGCNPCLDAGTECSLLALSPQSRKRKIRGDPFSESTVKRGYVE